MKNNSTYIFKTLPVKVALMGEWKLLSGHILKKLRTCGWWGWGGDCEEGGGGDEAVGWT